jgi:GTPase SAR1 family protein
LVQGPPGTGKSHLIISLIENLLLSKKKIHICAPSNNALESLLIRLNKNIDLFDYRKSNSCGFKAIKIGRLDEENNREIIKFNIDYIVSVLL